MYNSCCVTTDAYSYCFLVRNLPNIRAKSLGNFKGEQRKIICQKTLNGAVAIDGKQKMIFREVRQVDKQRERERDRHTHTRRQRQTDKHNESGERVMQ